jgi:hypothetical protein
MLHQLIQKAAPLFDDAFNAARKLGGGFFGKPVPAYVGTNGGKFGSPEFFADARAGNETALNLLKSKGYGHAWGVRPLRGLVEREIKRDLRPGIRKVPLGLGGGLLGGHAMKGYERVADNIWGKSARLNLGITSLIGGFAIGAAPRGKMANRTSETLGLMAGQAIGGAVGGGLFGVAGELVGNLVGGWVGEKVGALTEPFEKIGSEARHANFGGHYQDNEATFTMRQRAVQEMGSSALNARRYLGSEAVLMHQ